jgi:hypothetical protein
LLGSDLGYLCYLRVVLFFLMQKKKKNNTEVAEVAEIGRKS